MLQEEPCYFFIQVPKCIHQMDLAKHLNYNKTCFARTYAKHLNANNNNTSSRVGSTALDLR